ncbi:MAG: hypothetical protein H8E31_00445 [Planctomycetes bacterium]|nr:hypothetical protein [Planctomycetota bacterium]
MTQAKDPTQALRQAAAKLPDAVEGTSCKQTSFKAGKTAFLYVGPGAKGIGWKAMFKLLASMDEARELAEKEPDRFGVGSSGWVSTWFSAEKPLPKKIWSRWLKESHAAATKGGGAKK